MTRRKPFEIAGCSIPAGLRATVDLPVTVQSDHTPVNLSVHVIHGAKEGPTMFVSAGVHGDEVIGVEIVRRLLRVPSLNRLAGTLLVVPIVNSSGFRWTARRIFRAAARGGAGNPAVRGCRTSEYDRIMGRSDGTHAVYSDQLSGLCGRF